MFVDDDIRLAPGALRAALRAHRANPHLPVIVGRLKKIRNDYWSNYWHYYYNVVFNKSFPCPYAVGMLSPGLCSVKRALADKIHPLFDETLPSREDLDLYMRLRHAGIGVCKEDAIEGFHDSRQGFWPMIRQRLWYEEGEMALWRKHGAARMAAFYKEQPQVPRKWVYAPVNLVFLAARRLWRIYLQAQRPGVRCCL